MIRLHPKSTRTDTLFPYTTLFRSILDALDPAKITGLYSTGRYKMSDLDRLASRAAIQDLYSDQLIGVDKRQEGRLASIWWDDAEWTIEGIGTYKGPEGALDLANTVLWPMYRSDERRVGKEWVSEGRI